jgi:hypothetical protein
MSRSARYTHMSFEESILRPIRASNKYYYSVFFHTWLLGEGEKYHNPWSNEYNVDLDRFDYLYIPATQVVAEPYPELDLAPFNVHGDPWEPFLPARVKELHAPKFRNHTLRMSVYALISLYKVTQMWKESNGCYRVMYTRPDVRYSMPFHPEWFELTDVLLPNTGHWPLTDRFAVGTPGNMLFYGERLLQAPQFARHNKLQSEALVVDVFKKNNFSYQLLNFNFRVVRANGMVTGIDAPNDAHANIGVKAIGIFAKPRPLSNEELRLLLSSASP